MYKPDQVYSNNFWDTTWATKPITIATAIVHACLLSLAMSWRVKPSGLLASVNYSGIIWTGPHVQQLDSWFNVSNKANNHSTATVNVCRLNQAVSWRVKTSDWLGLVDSVNSGIVEIYGPDQVYSNLFHDSMWATKPIVKQQLCMYAGYSYLPILVAASPEVLNKIVAALE